MKTDNDSCNTVALPKFLNQKQVADILGVSTKLMERMRWRGGGPLYRKIGGNVRYELADVLAWVDSKPKKASTSQKESPK